MSREVQGSETIAARSDDIYALISDLPRMGEWSPENTGGRWLGDASSAVVGATFKGENRNGSKSWTTKVTVTVAQPGESFAFAVTFGPMPIADWRYDLVESAASTTVTETWRDRRNPLMSRLGGVVTGVSDRSTHTQTSITTTLAALKLAAEAHTAS